MPRFLTPVMLACAFGAAAQAAQDGAYALVNGPSGPVKAPLFSEQHASLAVAKVDDQAVTLREFSEALAEMHASHSDGTKAGKKNFEPVLDRLIGARLIAMEAHEMGLDEDPFVKKSVADFAELMKRAVVEEQVTKDVVPDQNQADAYYRDAVREWRLRSVLFAKEPDAKAASAALKKGAKWEEATKKGESSESQEYVRAGKMLPGVAEALQGVFTGQVTEPIKLDGGWALVRVEDIRYPDDAKERAKADGRALDEAREKVLKAWYAALVKSTVTTNEKLLRSLDYEAKKPGFAALQKDKRVIATVKDGKPITVADLTAAIRKTFFHGVEEAIKIKRVNEQKVLVYEKVQRREVMGAEAKRRHIEDTPEYRRRVDEYRSSIVFGLFVQKAILPGLKVTEEEGKKYYEEHKGEFTTPAFYKLQSIVFGSTKQAQSAYDKLKSGTDFGWLKANAEGQIPEDRRAADFNGTTVSASALPEALAAKLKGSRPGDYRLHSMEGQHFVLKVLAATAEQQQPYLQVRADIGKKLSAQKVNKAVEEWVAKLRKAHDVKVYLTQVGI
jgi:parvulin-like peptidyl-prolyl isomerase